MSFSSFLRSLKYAGATNLPEYDVQRGVCVGVNLMCLSIFFLNIVSGLLFYCLSGNLRVIIGAYFEAVLVLGIIALNRQRYYEAANISFYTIILVATFYFSAILGKGSETQLMILFILGLTFFVFEKTRTRATAIALAFLLLFLLEYNYSHPFITPADFNPQVALFVRWLVYAVVVSLVLLIFYLYQKNTGLLIRLHSYSKTIKASLDSEERHNELKNLYFQNISHDIKGCYFGLGTICHSVLDMVQARQEISKETATLLYEQSQHYKHILDSFLEFSSFKNAAFDDIQLGAFNVKEEIQRIAAIYRFPAMQKKVQIEFVESFQFPRTIVGDRLKITRILTNLLSNAIKFSREDTTVVIRLTHDAGFWKLSVEDQGRGMRQEMLEKIYKPYVTEKSQYNPEGIGLGLHITKYLADLIGAEIHVKSQQGTGTTFEVTFFPRPVLTP